MWYVDNDVPKMTSIWVCKDHSIYSWCIQNPSNVLIISLRIETENMYCNQCDMVYMVATENEGINQDINNM